MQLSFGNNFRFSFPGAFSFLFCSRERKRVWSFGALCREAKSSKCARLIHCGRVVGSTTASRGIRGHFAAASRPVCPSANCRRVIGTKRLAEDDKTKTDSHITNSDGSKLRPMPLPPGQSNPTPSAEQGNIYLSNSRDRSDISNGNAE